MIRLSCWNKREYNCYVVSCIFKKTLVEEITLVAY